MNIILSCIAPLLIFSIELSAASMPASTLNSILKRPKQEELPANLEEVSRALRGKNRLKYANQLWGTPGELVFPQNIESCCPAPKRRVRRLSIEQRSDLTSLGCFFHEAARAYIQGAWGRTPIEKRAAGLIRESNIALAKKRHPHNTRNAFLSSWGENERLRKMSRLRSCFLGRTHISMSEYENEQRRALQFLASYIKSMSALFTPEYIGQIHSLAVDRGFLRAYKTLVLHLAVVHGDQKMSVRSKKEIRGRPMLNRGAAKRIRPISLPKERLCDHNREAHLQMLQQAEMALNDAITAFGHQAGGPSLE